QRPHHHVAVKSVRTTAPASCAREGATRAGRRRWVRQGSSSICVKSKGPERRTRVGLAICFSVVADFGRSAQRTKTTTSRGRRNFAKCDQKSSGRVQNREACELPQSAALLCNASTDSGLRHSHCAGIAWTQRREHDDDLYARTEQARRRRQKPARLNTESNHQRSTRNVESELCRDAA